ncbi:hypothetical protein IC229_30255 [Spirosoma sp. BT702]|uniref:Uncharacterized protein n=1 Tax=Spirosoma profusum TaxID=2771354 RepID=A0A927AV24_9BACT|nr:hypothetical protein [Spirosoma profusum]MBD2704952.1 hypothetical protein [Spirosoma profusum]
MPVCFTTVEYGGDLADRLLSSPQLRFDEVRERGNRTVKRYYTTIKLRDFSFTIYPSTGKVVMKGSWAKFHNNGQHNHSRYSTKDLWDNIADLSDMFGYDLSDGLLHGLEAGVNLDLSSLLQPYFSPNYLLQRIICYQGRKPFLPMKSVKGAGQGIECVMTNYRIKVYDKGTQYRLPQPLLRFEYDCNMIKELESLVIQRLIDLTDSTKITLLGQKVQRMLSDLIIVEPVITNSLSRAERKLYEKAERPSFWQQLNSRDRNYYLKEYRELIKTYSVHRLHETLCEQAQIEWNILTENCNIFADVHASNRVNGLARNCNVFLPVNVGKRYNNPEEIDSSNLDIVTKKADTGYVVQPIPVAEETGVRCCEVTGVLLHKDQPKASMVVGITTLKKTPGLLEEFRQLYGQKKRKRSHHSEEYRLAHGPRNQKSNGPNNLRRRVLKSINNTLLFPATTAIRLTDEQLATLAYFSGTPYELKLDFLR